MTALAVTLVIATVAALAVGAVTAYTARGLRRQITALREELLTACAHAEASADPGVPAARRSAEAQAPRAEIRAAVAEALTAERERELAEARAFWAAQEAREAEDAPFPPHGLAAFGPEATAAYEDPDVLGALFCEDEGDRFEGRLFLPRQVDFSGLEPLHPRPEGDLDAWQSGPFAECTDFGWPRLAAGEPVRGGMPDLGPGEAEAGRGPGIEEPLGESPELAAARRRHPSHPDFQPGPAISDHERTVARLEELAQERTPLTDVRPGPLGTLDVYVFADGTTICMTPGDRTTAERVAAALREGDGPVLLGGSGISGAYALTFAWGADHAENAFVLADRVIASV
ncbi:hypothetical protein ACFV3R_24320 [Streptomyces sp. NPDC059740]|uniref:hypothetical protein n=1 Tax=Streptomyces sp. NPDC059740 TaxID=3346926 RepID=UPI00364846CF